MFRDTQAEDGGAKKGQDKEKMQDGVLTKEQLAARQPRALKATRRMASRNWILTARIRRFSSKPRRASKPTRRAMRF